MVEVKLVELSTPLAVISQINLIPGTYDTLVCLDSQEPFVPFPLDKLSGSETSFFQGHE